MGISPVALLTTRTEHARRALALVARLEACYNGFGTRRYSDTTHQPRDPVGGLARLLARCKGAG